MNSQTLGQMLQSSSQYYANQEAVVSPGMKLTFKEYNILTNQLANYLLHNGVQKGDRVAYLVGINGAAPISLMAIAKIGAIAVPLNFMWSKEMTEWALDHIDAKFVLYEDRFAPLVKEKILLDSIPSAQIVENHELSKRFLGELRTYSMDYPDIEVEPNDPITIVFTSGTTGLPKGVVSTHKAFIASAIKTSGTTENKPGDRFLLALPTFHISGIVIMLSQPLLKYTLVFLPQLDPKGLLDIMEQEKINLTFMPPTLLSIIVQMIEQSDYLLPSLDRFISGGSKVPVRTIKNLEEMGFKVLEVYGATETNGIVSCWKPEFGYDSCHTVGKVYLYPEVKILDRETRKELPIGQIGELAVSGDTIFQEYWKNPEATKEAFHEGYYLTGDAAKVDTDGFIEIVDRYKDVIYFSGFGGVYPSEVEKVIFEIEGIEEACVVGVQHPDFGEFPCAFVRVKEGMIIDKSQILNHVHAQLERYKLGDVVLVKDPLPKIVTGKIDKGKLKAMFLERMKRMKQL
ncbi:class I adenylate-forming enzyme family protein [Laceyella putida]|uniref:Class I adenylate-forming enzyme family protein n=1 Tax=Laceyella putida TaxID=110101 RepID=A0ABW2RP36_9BACL